MEHPVLGLAYVKVAADGSWTAQTQREHAAQLERAKDMWRRSAPARQVVRSSAGEFARKAKDTLRRNVPEFIGGETSAERQAREKQKAPAVKPTPTPTEATPTQASAATPATQQTPAAETLPPLTPSQKRDLQRSEIIKQRRERLKAAREKRLAYERSPEGMANIAARDKNDAVVQQQIRDAQISKDGGEGSPGYFKNEQARREQAGDWAWESARGLARQRQNPYAMPNFASSGSMSMGGGQDQHALESAQMGDTRNAVQSAQIPGMTKADVASVVNRFSDTQRLEGQNAPGMGLDEFDRYMARYYPEQQRASRERYAKPQIQWGEERPMYQMPSQTPGKAPIQWAPTTYEQAARMGVLDGGKLKAPGSVVPLPTMKSYDNNISAWLTEKQQAKLEANGGWPKGGVAKRQMTMQEWWSDPARVKAWQDKVNEGRSTADSTTKWTDASKTRRGSTSPTPAAQDAAQEVPKASETATKVPVPQASFAPKSTNA